MDLISIDYMATHAWLRRKLVPALALRAYDNLRAHSLYKVPPMASRKRTPFSFRSANSKKKGQGSETLDETVNQPSSVSSSVGPSTSHLHASTSKQSTGRNIGNKFREIFSGTTTPASRPTTPTPQPIAVSHTIEQEPPRHNVEVVPAPAKLVSKRASEVIEEATGTNETKIALLDLGIGAIDLLRQVSDVAGLVLPNPVGPVLEKVTAVLGTLKQMMENKSAWQHLLRTLDNHQQVFNQQLTRLKKENLDADSSSPFLGPVKQYSIALEEILAAIIKDSGLNDKNTPRGGAWETVKNFSSRFINAGSEQGQIQAYERQVSDAMGDLKLALVLYISDKIQEISNKMASNEGDAVLAQLKLTDLQFGSPLPGCMEGTRLDILEKIKAWTTDFDAPNILWLKGHPGVGKSAIATNVVEQLRISKRLGSNFFFQRQRAALTTTNILWCTVAYDLARRHYTVREQIITALKEDEALPTTVNVDRLFRLLIEQPITASKDIIDERLPVVVIDALDECGGLDGQQSEARRSVMRSLESWSRLPSRFKLIVTSRDESDIARLFSRTKHHPIELSAGRAVEAQSSEDIRTFLTRQLQQRVVDQYEDSFSPDWPGPQVVDDLADKAAGLFIWANTVVNFISLGDPEQRLNLVLKGSGTGDMKTLYSQVLSTSFPHPNEDEINNFHRVVGAVILAKEPLSVFSLGQLLSLKTPTMRYICNGLQSILESKDILRFHHQSFVDFLVDPDGCPTMFLIKQEQETRSLTLACLRAMKETLRFNICDLNSSYLRNTEVPNLDSLAEQCILPHISYSSRFWASHLSEAPFDVVIFKALQYFMENQFLFWLEVLSLLKRVNIASNMLLSLIDWIQAGSRDDTLARDMRRFVAGFSSAIAQSAPHIYLSALPFSPRNSAVSKQYRDRFPRTLAIQTGGLRSWPAIQNVLLGHTSAVNSVACTPDGRHIVSGSSDGTIRVWDAETGQVVVGPLQRHRSDVNSVAFSPDGQRVVSGSGDHTILVWDAKTGEVLAGPFEGHSKPVRSVTFSPDGTRLVSGSEDCTIRVWNAETGEPILGPLEEHRKQVSSVAFSPNGIRIASGSWDNTILVWDAETGNVVAGPFKGHGDWVRSVAFSPDGLRIVSGSDDLKIRVWDAKTDKLLAGPFEGHSACIKSVAFSPNGYRVVSGSADHTIRVWDAETGEVMAGPFNGHSGVLNSVAFLPDGGRIVSGSHDHTIRVWDSETGLADAVPFGGHSGTVWSVAFSPDGTRIISGSSDRTIRVWDVETGEMVVGPLEGHSGEINSIAVSPNGTRIASGSDDGTIRVWDVQTGKGVVGPLERHSSRVVSISFSPDGKRITSGSWDDTILVWDAEMGKVVAGPFRGHSSTVSSVAFSPARNHVVSGSWDKTLRVWDATTGELVVGPLNGHDAGIRSVALSPDGRHIASGSDDKTIRVWDVDTGEVIVGPLAGHSGEVLSVAFSPDGTCIVSGSEDHTVRIWDAGTGEMIAGPFHGHSQGVNSVAFSPDGSSVVSGSGDRTIRFWDTRIGILKVTETSPFTETSEMLDGWMLGSNSELLFWVPPSLREGLFWPSTHGVIGNFISTKLDLAYFVHGESWSQCKE